MSDQEGGLPIKSGNLQATVQSLVDRRIEGTHWDFKLYHHENRAALIHDILCLANAGHDGPRYLIYGVKDKTFELHSIDDSLNRKTQADLVGFFRDNASKFFQSRTPSFYLREVQFGPNTIDVLVIEDQPHKPYYLIEDYDCSRCSGRVVLKHHIYTRVGDANTPITEAAPSHEIERMWRERFGLDKSPLERARQFLREPGSWKDQRDDGLVEATWYHTTFPEFTLRVDSTGSELLDCNSEWTRGEIRKDDNAAGFLKLYYHQTLLAQDYFVVFDNRKKTMVAPDWKPRGASRLYFYLDDSLTLALQEFWSSEGPEDYSKSLRIGGLGPANNEARAFWPSGMPIPVVSAVELEGFFRESGCEGVLEPSTDETEQYQLFLRNQIDFEKWRSAS